MKENSYIIVSVADTGVGMTKKQYEDIKKSLRDSYTDKRTSKTGIGLGNIYKRIHTMYENGQVKIYSVEGKGTVIQVWIPQNALRHIE